MNKQHIKKYINYDGKNHSLKKLDSWLKSTKYKITDERVVADNSSPTGKTYIGIAKKPLVKVEKGFGWYGVLAQTDNREFVQCHECGIWFRRLSAGHLEKFHKLSVQEYRKKYGILVQTGLIADAFSYKKEESARKFMFENWKDPKFRAKMIEQLRKGAEKSAKTNKGNKHSTERILKDEHNNKYALCEKQLGYRIVEYIRKYKFLPTGSVKGEGDNIVHALITRYGSRNLGFRHYELPTFHRMGFSVEMTAPNGKVLNYNYHRNNYDREKIYRWICSNTPNLKNDLNKFAE